MALFKVFKGNDASNLNSLDKHDGYSYYDTSATRFYIDAFYPPTTTQTAIIEQYLTNNPSINRNDKTETYEIPYTETVNSVSTNKKMYINFIDKKNDEDCGYLVLDRRSINQDSITTAYFVNITTHATDPQTGQKTDEIIRTRRALKVMYPNGSTTYQTVVSPVPNSTTNAIAFFMDADGRLSTTAAPYTGGDPQFLVDPEKGILTAPKFNGYIVAGSTTVVNNTETFVEVGKKATAEGEYTVASGTASHAEGNKTQATGFGAHAEGTETSVTIDGVSVNYPLMASGVASHAEGMGNTAAGNSSHAEGQLSYAGALAAHAEGNNTTATGPTSHAEGNHAQATGQAAHAEGEQTVASATGAHAEGLSATASGNYSHAEGSGTEASGSYSHAEGADTEASYIAHAEGWATVASGTASHAEGRGTQAENHYSHAEGYNTTVSGLASHAEGWSTVASATVSHAEGRGTHASGSYSHAEGRGTTALGAYSHAEGYETEASGLGAHAEGRLTHASTTAAHAEGTNTTASGYHSHAEGAATIASSYAQHVFGAYNIAEPATPTATKKSTYVEIVGNGTSTARSDARRLAWNGNEWLAGKLTVGANAVDPWDVPTLSQVQSLITNNGAMTFKGTIGVAADNPTTTALPATHSVGWTYTVITADTYAGVSCNIGDMIVCTTAGTNSNSSDWAIIPNNADGKVLGPSSSQKNEIAVFTDGTGKAITGSGMVLPANPEFTDTKYTFHDGTTGNFLVREEDAISFTSVSIGKPTLALAAERAYLDDFGTTTGNIAYYLDTSGTFGTDNNFNWNSTNQTLNALRLNGYVVSGQLKNTAGEYIINPGQQATAEGINTSASATGSHAEGYQTEACGSYAHAEGYSSSLATSSGNDDEPAIEDPVVEEDPSVYDDTQGGDEVLLFSSGVSSTSGTRAIGFASHVEGYDTVASATAAHAEGRGTTASGIYSHAEGEETIASATAAHAEGEETIASNRYAHAEGYQTTASEESSHAEGSKTVASGHASHAEGHGTIAAGSWQHVVGSYNIQDGNAFDYTIGLLHPNYIEIVGNGTTPSNRSNARTLDWEGNEWLAGKITAEGGIEGYITAGQATVPGLYDAPPANTDDEGGLSVGESTHYGDGHVYSPYDFTDEEIAKRTQQIELYTIGQKATSEGFTNNSHGNYSHTEGQHNSALGDNSHAEGEYAVAQSYAAHAEGYGTVARGKAQHVFGIYNIPDPAAEGNDPFDPLQRGTYVEIVGNGQEPATIPERGEYDYDPAQQPYSQTCSNARTLDWDGNEWLAGSLTAENNITTNGSLTIGGHVALVFNAETNALDFNFI